MEAVAQQPVSVAIDGDSVVSHGLSSLSLRGGFVGDVGVLGFGPSKVRMKGRAAVGKVFDVFAVQDLADA